MAQKISSPQDSQKSYGELFNKKINDAAKIYLYNFLREPDHSNIPIALNAPISKAIHNPRRVKSSVFGVLSMSAKGTSSSKTYTHSSLSGSQNLTYVNGTP